MRRNGFIVLGMYVLLLVGLLTSPTLADVNIYQKIMMSTFMLEVDEGSGSCVCIAKDKHETWFLTCAHVAEHALKGKGTLIGTRDFPLTEVHVGKVDKKADLALMSYTDGPDVTPVAVAKDAPSLGDPVFSCGAPYGVPNLCVFGRVSAYDTRAFLDTDVLFINLGSGPGMSGAPACNERGEIVGIVKAHIPETTVCITISSQVVRKFMEW